MSKNNTHIIEVVTPPTDGKSIEFSHAPRAYFGGIHGTSTPHFTDNRAKAERHPSKSAALARASELFNPGFVRVTPA